MLSMTDWTGLGVFIGSIFTGIVAVIGAIAALKANNNTKLPDRRSVADVSQNVEAALTTPPGHAPVGEVLADVAQNVTDIKNGS